MLIKRTDVASRRTVLRGFMGGAAVTVGLPLLDVFLNSNGNAFASGAALPSCFGTWFQGLGGAPGLWEPKVIGANYEMNQQMRFLAPFKKKINIYSGLKAHGRAPDHTIGQAIAFAGNYEDTIPQTIDTIIGDHIGTKTRFRSIEVACDGSTDSVSRRGPNIVNASEPSPIALYARIFGPEFKDPNAAEFTPDPDVMVRRSALSAVSEQREALLRTLGASDRARLDEYFSSLRETEKQLEIQLEKPAPMAACAVPAKLEKEDTGVIIDQARETQRIFAKLIAHAMACGQTQVFNVNFGGGTSRLRTAESAEVFHIYTHEEATDPKLGYQPTVNWFQEQTLQAVTDFVAALDSIKEGDGTLLDRSLMMYCTDHGYARYHTSDNIPMLTAGGAGGRIKTGYHIHAPGDPMTRVGLTVQQALGVPVDKWGQNDNETSKTFTEILA